jgi:hypothetical protein
LAEAWEGPPGNLGDPVFAHATKQPGRGDGRVIKLSWPARLSPVERERFGEHE